MTIGAVVTALTERLGRDRRLAALEQRIAALEHQIHDIRRFEYLGVFEPGRAYARNSCVSHQGSMWMALRDEVASRPGAEPADWQLAVKRGRDAASR